MLPFRKLGAVLRGKASTPQVVMAAVLGCMLGFVPGFVLPGDLGGGFRQAPGLTLALLLAALVLNANLTVFGICLAASKLLSLLLLPVSFAVGRLLLDGPTAPLLEAMIAAPVLAWFGLEYYATTGGLVLGAATGGAVAFALARLLRLFRTTMAALEQGSELFQRWSGKRSVKVATWLMLGRRKHAQSYTDLLAAQRRGLPIRLGGVAAVLVLGAGLWLAQDAAAGPAFQRALQRGLERCNGATVDVGGATLDLAAGRVEITGLAAADPHALDRDQLRMDALALQIDTGSLLARRLVITEAKSASASSGASRATPGRLVRAPEPPPPPAPLPEGSADLEHYLKEARKWKDRLQQASAWLDRLSGDAGGGDGEPDPDATPQGEERAIEREIDRQVREYGLACTVATHRIARAPRVLVRTLALEGIAAAALPGDLLDVHAKNLSSDPGLVRAPLELSIKARSGRFAFHFRFDPQDAGGPQTVFTFRDLPVDALAGQWAHEPPVRGGALDVRLDGRLARGPAGAPWLDLPLRVTLRGTTLHVPGLAPTAVDELTLPLGLHGPLAAPAVRVDDGALADALVAAGKRELATQLRNRATELLDRHLPGAAGEELRGVLQGAQPPGAAVDAARQQAEAEAKRQAEEELKKRLPGGFGGILGGRK